MRKQNFSIKALGFTAIAFVAFTNFAFAQSASTTATSTSVVASSTVATSTKVVATTTATTTVKVVATSTATVTPVTVTTPVITVTAVTSVTPSCAPYITLYNRYGYKNAEVEKLQAFLNEYNDAKLPVTGYFGSMTENAVKNFQWNYGVAPVSGIQWNKTTLVINNLKCGVILKKAAAVRPLNVSPSMVRPTVTGASTVVTSPATVQVKPTVVVTGATKTDNMVTSAVKNVAEKVAEKGAVANEIMKKFEGVNSKTATITIVDSKNTGSSSVKKDGFNFSDFLKNVGKNVKDNFKVYLVLGLLLLASLFAVKSVFTPYAGDEIDEKDNKKKNK